MNDIVSCALKKAIGRSHMDGFYTTHNESAALVTAPATVDETRQRDTRAMVAAVEEGDGKKWA